jgi:hypothetical protein
MKKLILFCWGMFAFTTVFAQTPASFKYQAVARNSTGTILANQLVGFRISILAGSQTGTSVFRETHETTTNEYGLVNLEIGNGTNFLGSLAEIDWGSDAFFIKIEMDPNGGNSYILMGVSQLLSVPYALRAKTVDVDRVNDADADPENELQVLQLSDNLLTLTRGGGTVTLPLAGGNDNWGTQVVLTDATLSGDGTLVHPLKIADNGITTVKLANESVTGDKVSRLGAVAGQALKWNGTTWAPGDDAASYWSKSGNNLSYMEGNIGIGMTPIGDRLEMFKADLNYIRLYTTASGTGSGQGMLMGMAGTSQYIWNYENGFIRFGTNNVTRMTITAAGDVGIGSAYPDATLDVQGTVTIGQSGLKFSEIREITGTLDADGVFSFAYPSGYSSSNMRVLSCEVNYAGTAWIGIAGTVNYTTDVAKMFYYLAGSIYIYYPNSAQFQNRDFRMLVMKVE